MASHRRIGRLASWAAGTLTTAALATPAGADTLAEFYKGRTIPIVIGFAPGGAYDLYAQLLSHGLPQ
jgi:tripartite-type tricarboxylate transporter receptor subunit TctC